MTIQEIAQEVYSTLSPEEKQYIISLSEADLISLHYSLGMEIRNQYVWHRQPEDAMNPHPDDISREIVKAIWEIATLESGMAE
jgi:hypothetical protein